jgi:2-succinyl-5-enolpyruvyl-6-hydroxy-3-cyclohexene-1-carboxylate synthase
VSTAVGVALGSGSPTSLLIGDVALLHDVNGLLALNRRAVDLSIVVTNNDGGSIFSFLPQAEHLDQATFELLYGTPHGVSFEHVAKTYGLAYFRAANEEALRAALAQPGTKIVEVVLDRAVNVDQHDELNSSIAAAVTTTA